ncbi:unnamed protein product [Notodromas monacha]|uniref:Uncharacterized protein n=1 Tax=Notodromas monacha TaxID=399045 RepID=A0A7R9BBI2_9CRUS|nr:unnamed protein product [Notodromas monacha]CAG0912252.1 unnamed protein product [Notodromas monacha]
MFHVEVVSSVTDRVSSYSARTANVKGEVLVNGNVRDLNTFRKQSSYIMQDDYVLGNLTVLETLQFAAELKCGSRSSPEERRDLKARILP